MANGVNVCAWPGRTVAGSAYAERAATAPAPALSRSGVLLAVSILAAIGGVAVLRRRRA